MLVLERNPVMYYEEINPIARKDAEYIFKHGNADKIEEALLRVTFHDEDWQWVQFYCLKFLIHPDKDVCAVAASCLGHLACIHGILDTRLVIPALKVHLTDPNVAARANDALNDISLFVRDNIRA